MGNVKRGLMRVYTILWILWAVLVGFVLASSIPESLPYLSEAGPIYWEREDLPPDTARYRTFVQVGEASGAKRQTIRNTGTGVIHNFPANASSEEMKETLELYNASERVIAAADSLHKIAERRDALWGIALWWLGLALLAPGLLLGAINWVWTGFSGSNR